MNLPEGKSFILGYLHCRTPFIARPGTEVFARAAHIPQIQWGPGFWLTDLPLWKIWKSIGMMTFQIYGQIIQSCSRKTTNQPHKFPSSLPHVVNFPSSPPRNHFLSLERRRGWGDLHPSPRVPGMSSAGLGTMGTLYNPHSHGKSQVLVGELATSIVMFNS